MEVEGGWRARGAEGGGETDNSLEPETADAESINVKL